VIYVSIPCGVRGHLGSIHSKQEDMGSAIGDIQAAVTDLGLIMTAMAVVHKTLYPVQALDPNRTDVNLASSSNHDPEMTHTGTANLPLPRLSQINTGHRLAPSRFLSCSFDSCSLGFSYAWTPRTPAFENFQQAKYVPEMAR
jgi:hypothetical protein